MYRFRKFWFLIGATKKQAIGDRHRASGIAAILRIHLDNRCCQKTLFANLAKTLSSTDPVLNRKRFGQLPQKITRYA